MDASYSRVARALADVETTEEKRQNGMRNFCGRCAVVQFQQAALPQTQVR